MILYIPITLLQGSVFEPLSEEEVNRRKQEEDEKTRVRMDKMNKKQEKKQKQAGMRTGNKIIFVDMFIVTNLKKSKSKRSPILRTGSSCRPRKTDDQKSSSDSTKKGRYTTSKVIQKLAKISVKLSRRFGNPAGRLGNTAGRPANLVHIQETIQESWQHVGLYIVKEKCLEATNNMQ